jgi:hypothetical protein
MEPHTSDDLQPPVWKIVLVTALVLVSVLAVVFLTTLAHARWRPEYAQLSPAEQQWFYNQQVPGGPSKGARCCSIADGTYAQEDIRYDAAGMGHHWTNFHYKRDTGPYGTEAGTEAESGWIQVPDELVIHEPNRHESAAVWYLIENGKPKIRCFIPGALF